MIKDFNYNSGLMRVIDYDMTPQQLKCGIKKRVKERERERERERDSVREIKR